MPALTILPGGMETDGTDVIISMYVAVEGNNGLVNLLIQAILPINSTPAEYHAAIRAAAIQACLDLPVPIDPGTDAKTLLAGVVAL